MSKQQVLSVGALTIAAAGAAGLLMLGSSTSGAMVAHGQSAGQRVGGDCCEVDVQNHIKNRNKNENQNKNKNKNKNVNVNWNEIEVDLRSGAS